MLKMKSKKETYLLLFLIFLSSNLINGQNIKGVADYDIKLAEDNLHYDGKLYFNEHKSVFRYKNHPKNKWVRDEGINQYQIEYTDNTGHLFEKKYSAQFYNVRSFCKKKPVIFLDKISIEWKLDNQQKMFGDILCKKATTNFRGRNYIVWYALSIPISSGPWKFHGLPGLIIEVKSVDGQIDIGLKNINYSELPSYNFDFKETSKIDFEEYLKCKDEEFEEQVNKDMADLAKLRAKFPDLEIDISHQKDKFTTELKYD